MSGVAEFAPYTARGSRLALAPIRFAGARDGSTAVEHRRLARRAVLQRARARRSESRSTGGCGSGGSFAFGTGCAVVSFAYLQTGALQFGPTRLPVCPIGPAIVSKAAGRRGAVRRLVQPTGAQRPAWPVAVASHRRQRPASRTSGSRSTRLAMRLGRPTSPIIFDAQKLQGSLAGSGLGGTFSGGALDDRQRAAGDERHRRQLARVQGRHHHRRRADRRPTAAPKPRFYPLHSDNVHFTLADGMVRGDGTLNHPASGTKVTDVTIEHRAGERRRPRRSRRAGHHLRPESAAGGADPADRRRDRAGPGHADRPGPDRLDRRARSPRPAISRPPASIWRRRSGR